MLSANIYRRYGNEPDRSRDDDLLQINVEDETQISSKIKEKESPEAPRPGFTAKSSKAPKRIAANGWSGESPQKRRVNSSNIDLFDQDI